MSKRPSSDPGSHGQESVVEMQIVSSPGAPVRETRVVLTERAARSLETRGTIPKPLSTPSEQG